jgi:TRAP-type C4-dicarboxylate transport system permease small subunit
MVYAAGLITGVAIAIISVANLFRLIILKISVPELLKIYDDSPDDVQTVDVQ